jgi:hypothetical protein
MCRNARSSPPSMRKSLGNAAGDDQLAESLEDTIRQSLNEFFAGIVSTGWRGREREAVSHFVFSYLLRHCGPSALQDAGQIGIEVAVPGVPGLNPKPQVCKDVVVWKTPGDTCWDAAGNATQRPKAILEWKCHRAPVAAAGFSEHDRKWLQAFTELWPDTIGFLVRLDLHPRPRHLQAGLVSGGRVTEGWLELPGAA